MNFFKAFLATLLGLFVFTFLGFLMLIAIGSAGSDEVKVEKNSILQLKLNKEIVENHTPDPFGFPEEFGPFGGGGKIGLYQLVSAIEKAAEDPNIKGIFLNTQGGIQAGWTSKKAIRDALVEFKESGKFLYSYAETYGEGTYYLASAADKIIMPRTGFVELNGFAATPVYFLGTLEKLEIEPKVFYVGKYKSATEPFRRKNMSPESREQVREFLGDMWTVFANEVSDSRDMDVDAFNELTDSFIFGDGKKALEAGLVDELLYVEDVRKLLKEDSGLDEDAKLKLVTLSKYIKVPKKGKKISKNKIAIIFGEGNIVSGKSEDGTMGSATIVKALRKAREDDKVKAVVFRVNSGGGSALASDMMAREVKITAEVKPVIVSMGDVAASGGYYISAYADRIFAQENTITGSIGILSVWLNTGKFFSNKLGITFDEEKTHANATLGNPNRPMTGAESAFIQQEIESMYDVFLGVVQEGRGFESNDAVHEIAQGRVWSGADALGINLVDEIGDLDDAIAYAAKQAGVEDDYRIRLLPVKKSPIEEIIESFKDASVEAIAKEDPMYREMEYLRDFRRMIPGDGHYALMPYTWDIK